MENNLLDVFPNVDDLLALSAEDLAGILIEIIPDYLQNGIFNLEYLKSSIYKPFGPSYPATSQRQVTLALAEALSWLTVQGLLILDPNQPTGWYALTRRTLNMKNRTDVASYSKSRMLPDNLLPTLFVKKVTPLFRRGDHDIAVFQAFKELEVAVRNAANRFGANYPDDLVGTKLMRAAFHHENGPLSDQNIVAAEWHAESDLFSGAIGHAKNPTSHRDVAISADEAARLIIFAGHLMHIIVRRSADRN